MGIKLPKKINYIIDKLKTNGYETFVVGGCVRDSLLGKKPKDWDLCTNARPEEIKAAFCNAQKVHTVDTGISHGTVTVVVQNDPFEITTFRTEGKYSDYRRPDNVSFANQIEDDLARRDFTINAMAYNNDRGLVDIYGGKQDLNHNVIRCVGKADNRFNEDALRIMRCIRFAGQLGFTVERDTEEAMMRKKGLLCKIAVERIREEFVNFIISHNFKDTIEKYKEVIGEFIPEIKDSFQCDQQNNYHIYDVWEHTIHATNNIAEIPVLRLAAFFHDIGKPACKTVTEEGWGHFYHHEKKSAEITEQIMTRMKFDNKTKDTVVKLIAAHGIVFNPKGKQPRRLLSKMGEEQLRLLIELERADVKSQAPAYTYERLRNILSFEKAVDKLIEEDACFSIKNLDVNGEDLINAGIPQGKEIGILLHKILDDVVEERLNNKREEIIRFIKNAKS